MANNDKKRIKELRKWAKENIARKEVYNKEYGDNVKFTVSGIKEYLNQPHEFYCEKNELIKEMIDIVKKSKYIGVTNYNNRNSHIFEIKIRGKNSWIIANEYKGRGTLFHSISDNSKVLTGIKK